MEKRMFWHAGQEITTVCISASANHLNANYEKMIWQKRKTSEYNNIWKISKKDKENLNYNKYYYKLTCWSSVGSTLAEKLERLQKRVARVVLREESGKDPVSQLAWANLHSRLQSHLCIFIFKCLKALIFSRIHVFYFNLSGAPLISALLKGQILYKYR